MYASFHAGFLVISRGPNDTHAGQIEDTHTEDRRKKRWPVAASSTWPERDERRENGKTESCLLTCYVFNFFSSHGPSPPLLLFIAFGSWHLLTLSNLHEENSMEEPGLGVPLPLCQRLVDSGPCMIRAMRSVSASANRLRAVLRGGRLWL